MSDNVLHGGATNDSRTELQRPCTGSRKTIGMIPPSLHTIPEDDAIQDRPGFKKYTIGDPENPPMYRELIGLAVATTISCPYCTHFRREPARFHGAIDGEPVEVRVEYRFLMVSIHRLARFASQLRATTWADEVHPRISNG